MKLKSLILGSVAAVGLSTGAFAADLGVLTSLDVCNTLGLSGLTISSETNCLQITGGVSYEFNWGDYKGKYVITNVTADQNPGSTATGPIDNDAGAYADGAITRTPADLADNLDWESQVEAWLQFVGTAPSDFGPAKAVIRLKSVNETRVRNEMEFSSDDDTGAAGAGGPLDGINREKGLWIADQAYVSVGDTTIVMAGKKSSIANFGDDEPFNFTGLFNSDEVDKGVAYRGDHPRTGGVAVQVVSDLGNGVNVGLGLENLERSDEQAGTLVGVISYAGEGITAHLTGYAGGILDGDVADYAMHAGFTGTFDQFKIRGAFAAGVDQTLVGNPSYWNGLVSAQATFDMFEIAVSGEATGGTRTNETDYGFGASIGANVTDGVKINLGGRYYNDASGPDGYQIAAQLVAAVTETIKITGEIGVYGTDNAAVVDKTDFYGAATLAWAPGGGFTTSLKGEAHQDGAYRVTYKAAKTFE